MKLAAASVASGAAVAGLTLAAHYPIAGPLAAPAVFAVIAACAFAWPSAWVVALPAAIPWLGFAPWTGWITFEELDMILLAVAAGCYARLARPRRALPGEGASVHAGIALCVALFAASIMVSFVRGIADAGGFRWGWFQGYHGAMNSARLAKSFFLALLFVPLWLVAGRVDPASSSARLTTGFCFGLAGASLAALWERLAFTDLLDFSTDYRTTALFWEMNVGGAAFDGFLALTVPFAVRELGLARAGPRAGAATLLLVLASYACLTTFSRGVFLAVPMGVGLTLWLTLRRQRAATVAPVDRRSSLAQSACVALGFLGAACWMFPLSGYRGMLALLGTIALLLRVGGDPSELGGPGWLLALVLGGALVGLDLLMAWRLPKGAYLAYAVVFALAVAGQWIAPRAKWLALACLIGLIAGIGSVSLHWGEQAALDRAMPVMATLVLIAFASTRIKRAFWPQSARWQAAVLGGLVAIGGLIGVLAGGTYMTDRVSTSGDDLQTRIDHWREGTGMLRTPAQQAFGVGLGRYPANFMLAHSATDSPGDYDLRGPIGEPRLALLGGKHMIGWGELLRVSQRVRPPAQPVVVTLRVRADRQAVLHLEVCEKHLLYSGACLTREVSVEPGQGAWQTVQTSLDGHGVSRGHWYAPRLVSFSMGNGTRGTLLEVADVQLLDARGDQLLINGDFAQGMAHWFFSSDRNHLPWHLKNIFIHVLFDQGALGLGVFVAMLVAALWRVAFGAARDHPLAPAIASAIFGFLIVGLFDSLLDVPRDAFIFYFLVLLGLTLQCRRSP